MRVTFWGVRGSVATPGPETSAIGGNTSCVQVTCSDGTEIVLDCGTGVRALGNLHVASRPPGAVSILVTHHHFDHVEGLRFYAPIFLSDFALDLYPLPAPLGKKQSSPLDQFNGTTFPMKTDALVSKINQKIERREKFRIGPATISRLPLNHPGGASGIRIAEGGRSVCYMTDDELNPPNGHITTPKEIASFVRETDLLIHDAQYVPSDYPAKRGWGHSLVEEVLELAIAARCQRLALFHHDPSRTDEQVFAIERDARARMRDRGFPGDVFAAREGVSVKL